MFGRDTRNMRLPSFLLLLVFSHCVCIEALMVEGDDCGGRRIYIHKLPRSFNRDLLLHDGDYEVSNKKWYSEQMLRVLERVNVNGGLGPLMKSPVTKPLLKDAWYSTDQFSLEVVFSARMANYSCLTHSYKRADLIYVPYFGGLDMARHMHEDNSVKERLARELSDWLQNHPAWRRHQGKDHFWVLGRETWDFRKNPDGIWGNNLLNLQGIKDNVLTVNGETLPWLKNDFCAPKPTGFHPQSLSDMQAWVRSVRVQSRPFLFSFVAGRRKKTTFEGQIREKLFWQCGESSSCYLGDCDAKQKLVNGKWVAGCESPRYVMRAYLKSNFCLHPRGDSCNRRSVLDSMLAGCIPVVFENCTLQYQYGWHVHSADVGSGDFFVHIPYDMLKGEHDPAVPAGGSELLMLEKVLRRIPTEKVKAMRRKVLKLIPRITYGGKPQADGSIQKPDFKDAFDIIVDGLFQIRSRNIFSA